MCNIQVTFSQHTVLAKPNICLIKVENCICILITWVRPIYLNPQKGQFFSHNLPTPSPNISNVCSSIWKFLPGGVRTHNMLSAEKPTCETFSQHKKRRIFAYTLFWYLIQMILDTDKTVLPISLPPHCAPRLSLARRSLPPQDQPRGEAGKKCNWKKNSGKKQNKIQRGDENFWNRK